MAKKIVAKTNISFGKQDGEAVDIAAGDEVKPNELGMTKTQLEQLYDAGAIELEESADARDEDKEKTAEETGTASTDESAAPPAAPVTESAPTKSTPAKATSSEAKSGGKGNAA